MDDVNYRYSIMVKAFWSSPCAKIENTGSKVSMVSFILKIFPTEIVYRACLFVNENICLIWCSGYLQILAHEHSKIYQLVIKPCL